MMSPQQSLLRTDEAAAPAQLVAEAAMAALREVDGDDIGYACESVLRKRKRKMTKHKLQKRRWKERMNRREFGR
jgi:hypothetical protein